MCQPGLAWKPLALAQLWMALAFQNFKPSPHWQPRACLGPGTVRIIVTSQIYSSKYRPIFLSPLYWDFSWSRIEIFSKLKEFFQRRREIGLNSKYLLSLWKTQVWERIYDSCYYNKVELPVSTARSRIYTWVTTRGLILRPDATATTIGLAILIYYILKRIRDGVVEYSTSRVIVLFQG